MATLSPQDRALLESVLTETREGPKAPSERTVRNSFTNFVEGIFFAIALTIVGVFTTTFALIFRAKTFTDDIAGTDNPESPLDLGAAAYFVTSLLTFFGMVYLGDLVVASGNDNSCIAQSLQDVMSGNLTSSIKYVLPFLAFAIVIAVFYRVLVFAMRGAATFEMSLRVILYSLGVLVMSVNLFLMSFIALLALSDDGSVVFGDFGTDPLQLPLFVVMFGAIALAVFAAPWVVFHLSRHIARVGWSGALVLTFAVVAGTFFTAFLTGEPMAEYLQNQCDAGNGTATETPAP